MSVFDVAYLQTRSFGTNECALRRHRDGHLVLASDRADAHLQKNPTAALLKCVCHNWVWLVAKKPPCSSLQPTRSQQHPHDTTSQTSRQFNLGFILYLVSPVSSHMPAMLVWVRCPGVSECMRSRRCSSASGLFEHLTSLSVVIKITTDLRVFPSFIHHLSPVSSSTSWCI